jgi:signal transduction histidine kinase
VGARLPGAGASGGSRLPESARRQIKRDFEHRLRSMRSPIMTNPDAVAELRLQIDSMLDEVVGSSQVAEPVPAGPVPAKPAPAETLPGDTAPGDTVPDDRTVPDETASPVVLASRIGTSRAAQGIHPTESLRAADALFEVALPVLTRECVTEAEGGPGAARLALTLHRTIMARVVQAAVPYVNFLLAKLYSSHREERGRMARELHDRAAHEIGVGLQGLELYEVYLATEPDRAREKFQAAEDALREALRTIRELSAELRESVVPHGLDPALRRYLQANVPPEVEVSFSAEGDTSTLTHEVSEELYLVLREAVRNALVHGHADALRVELELNDGELRATVTDNGAGFDLGETLRAAAGDGLPSPAGVGMASMQERIDLLGGTLTVVTALGTGTTVEVRLHVFRAFS